jgi:molybdopterin-guanine dinucleotide biosynthesis protein A
MGGGDKTMLRLGKSTMLRRIIDRLAPQVHALAISANGDLSRFSAFSLPVLPDTVPGYAGPLAGILAGLKWTAAMGDSERLLTTAGDTPFFPCDLADRLAEAASEMPDRIAVAASGGSRHPVFALWPVALKEDLERFLMTSENRRVTAFIDAHDSVVIDFPSISCAGQTIDPFFNVNMPADLSQAQRFLEVLDP